MTYSFNLLVPFFKIPLFCKFDVAIANALDLLLPLRGCLSEIDFKDRIFRTAQKFADGESGVNTIYGLRTMMTGAPKQNLVTGD